MSKNKVYSPSEERGLTIYHNPRCSTSRKGLEVVKNSGKEFEIIKYLETIPSEKELTEIIGLLNIAPIDLVRKNEKIWKGNYKGHDLSDTELIKIMVENPKLIERPIVINNTKAVIGRPVENILSIL